MVWDWFARLPVRLRLVRHQQLLPWQPGRPCGSRQRRGKIAQLLTSSRRKQGEKKIREIGKFSPAHSSQLRSVGVEAEAPRWNRRISPSTRGRCLAIRLHSFPLMSREDLPCRLIRFTAVSGMLDAHNLRGCRRLTAPEALEIRAIPGGSLLELLFGAPLINPFFALLGADSDLQDTRESPGLTSRSEDRLIRLTEVARGWVSPRFHLGRLSRSAPNHLR